MNSFLTYLKVSIEERESIHLLPVQRNLKLTNFLFLLVQDEQIPDTRT